MVVRAGLRKTQFFDVRSLSRQGDLACVAFIRCTRTVVGDLDAGRTPADESEGDTGTLDGLASGLVSRPTLSTWGGSAPLAGRRRPNGEPESGSPPPAEWSERWPVKSTGLADSRSSLDSAVDRGPNEAVIIRSIMKGYISQPAGAGLADQTHLGYLARLRTFLDHGRRHDFLLNLPEARPYPDDMRTHCVKLLRPISRSPSWL